MKLGMFGVDENGKKGAAESRVRLVDAAKLWLALSVKTGSEVGN